MGDHQRAVISASREQLAAVDRLVRAGKYKNVSEFVRHALAEALKRETDARLAAQVDAYVAAGHADEDLDVIEWQAHRGPRRAKR